MKQWKCQICGYISKGDEPPDKCPVCGADKSQFILIEPEITSADSVTAEQPAAKTTETPQPEDSGKPTETKPLIRLSPTELFNFLSDKILKYHLHPITVHIPNGVVPISVLFVFIAILFKSAAFDQAAYYNLIFVILSMPAVALTGYVEWNKRYGGNITNVFIIKMVCAAIVLLTALIAVSWRIINPDIAISSSDNRFPYVMLHLLMLGAAGVAGHLGGKLVFKD